MGVITDGSKCDGDDGRYLRSWSRICCLNDRHSNDKLFNVLFFKMFGLLDSNLRVPKWDPAFKVRDSALDPNDYMF